MKKGMLYLSILLAGIVHAQEEFALNTVKAPDLSLEIARPEVIGNIATPMVRSGMIRMQNPHPADLLDITPSYPAGISLKQGPAFGSDFTISSDTLTGHRLIDFKRQVTELMVFAKNGDGKLVMAQLFHMVRSVELDFPEDTGTYRIELLTREGDKTTLYLQ